MKLIQYPLKLIGIIKQASLIREMLQKQDTNRYLDPHGKEAYEAADTPKKKVLYFYDYLISIAKSKDRTMTLYKIAFVMADAMDQSTLEFAGYPNILQADKNPLVAYVKDTVLPAQENTLCAGLLCALHHAEKAEDYRDPDRRPFQKLTYATEAEGYSDLYKIERDIIWAFCTETKNKTHIGPYSYNITSGTQTKENSKKEAN